MRRTASAYRPAGLCRRCRRCNRLHRPESTHAVCDHVLSDAVQPEGVSDDAGRQFFGAQPASELPRRRKGPRRALNGAVRPTCRRYSSTETAVRTRTLGIHWQLCVADHACAIVSAARRIADLPVYPASASTVSCVRLLPVRLHVDQCRCVPNDAWFMRARRSWARTRRNRRPPPASTSLPLTVCRAIGIVFEPRKCHFSRRRPTDTGTLRRRRWIQPNDPPPDGNAGRSFAAGTADCIAARFAQHPGIATVNETAESTTENNSERSF